MRQAQELGLRAAAERLGISPAYLSRVERGKERPPRSELVKRLAALLGGDSDLLFRLAESTDPDLAEYVRSTPTVPEFLRTARAMRLTADDFAALIVDLKRRRPATGRSTSGRVAVAAESTATPRDGPVRPRAGAPGGRAPRAAHRP